MLTILSIAKPLKHARPPDAPFRSGEAWLEGRTRAAELTWVLLGKLALISSNAVLMLLLAHRLELELYGLLVTVISAQLLLSRVLMLGVDSGMIRLRTVPDLRSQSQEIVRAGLVVMWYTIVALVLVSLAVGPVVSWLAVPSWALAAVVVGAIGTALVDYGYSFHLAQAEYRVAAFVQGGTALGRLGVTALAVLLLPHYPLVVFLTFPGVSLISGLAQTARLKRGHHLRPQRALVSRLLRYSLWQGGANVVVVLSLYQGTFLLMLLGQRAATGIFGLALTLSLGFFAVYNGFSEYLFSRVARVDNPMALPRFLARSFGTALILITACVPLIFAIGMLTTKLVRPELRDFAPIFYCLSASMLLLVLQCPLEAACHYLLRPHLVMLGWVLRVVSIGFLGLALSPVGSAMGAAIAQLCGTVLALIALAVLVAGALRSAGCGRAGSLFNEGGIALMGSPGRGVDPRLGVVRDLLSHGEMK